jgi:hypothetical protein
MNNYRHLPPDLWPRSINVGGEVNRMTPIGNVSKISEQAGVREYPTAGLGEGIVLTRNLIGQAFTIGTAPVRLVQASYQWPYLVLNPTTSVGLTTSVTGFNGTATNGATSTAVGVSGFDEIHLILNVTGITGGDSWDIYLQAFDPINSLWVDSQAVFTGIIATGTSYSFPGSFGVATDIRFRFDRTVGVGNLTCTITEILKNGIGGSLAGLSQAVYLGGPNVTTVSGFPLLEGQKQTFVISEGVELWAVAATTITIRVFQL